MLHEIVDKISNIDMGDTAGGDGDKRGDVFQNIRTRLKMGLQLTRELCHWRLPRLLETREHRYL